MYSVVHNAVDKVLSTRQHYGHFLLGPRLSSLASTKVQRAIEYGWAHSTLKKYGQGYAAFERFCDSEDVPVKQCLPADKFLLCAFAASCSGEIAGVTARGAIAAGRIHLRYTLRGVENLTPASSKRDQCPPVTEAMLAALDKNLDHNDPQDTAVFVNTCCAFWGQIRIGKILSETQKSFIPGRIPLVSDLAPPSTRAVMRTAVLRCLRILKLPHTKTKGDRGDIAMLCRQHGVSDPINAVNNHIRINSVPDSLPLFSHRDQAGGLICLTRKKPMLRCNSVWSALGFAISTGQSFRIGDTTKLLLAGVSPSVVQAMGRWRSDMFLVYWCRLDLLVPLHTEFLEL
ncbi:hypothetical protein B0H17DRAFT_1155973 [Mycena rosella]|uniref:Uncharacterized protein n=1 Tax=Mycena rosella TaxID=1033263 RepID=A0AAD7H0C2_MYCRO|nr:hypothetical protein B0H17DRAFT_1155973 [Mycena rosella]